MLIFLLTFLIALFVTILLTPMVGILAPRIGAIWDNAKPLLLQNYSDTIRMTIVGVSVALIIFAIWLSKKEGIMTE